MEYSDFSVTPNTMALFDKHRFQRATRKYAYLPVFVKGKKAPIWRQHYIHWVEDIQGMYDSNAVATANYLENDYFVKVMLGETCPVTAKEV